MSSWEAETSSRLEEVLGGALENAGGRPLARWKGEAASVRRKSSLKLIDAPAKNHLVRASQKRRGSHFSHRSLFIMSTLSIDRRCPGMMLEQLEE